MQTLLCQLNRSLRTRATGSLMLLTKVARRPSASHPVSLSKNLRTYGNLIFNIAAVRRHLYSWLVILKAPQALHRSLHALPTSRKFSSQEHSTCHRCYSLYLDKIPVSPSVIKTSILSRCLLKRKVSTRRCAAKFLMS